MDSDSDTSDAIDSEELEELEEEMDDKLLTLKEDLEELLDKVQERSDDAAMGISSSQEFQNQACNKLTLVMDKLTKELQKLGKILELKWPSCRSLLSHCSQSRLAQGSTGGLLFVRQQSEHAQYIL